MTKKELVKNILGTKELINHLVNTNIKKVADNKELKQSIYKQLGEWNELVKPVIESKGLKEKKEKYEEANIIANNIYKQVNWLINTKY